MSPSPLEISTLEVKSLLDQGIPLRLIDVRELFEFAQARIEGVELIPMRTVPRHLEALRGETRPIIILCHHGMRSLRVVEWLREQGVTGCRSMAGGIDEWSREIDPSVGRYY